MASKSKGLTVKIVVIGAVAGGASAAARARRLNEDAEIVLIERGPEPSFANCGLPYYVGGEIESRKKLLVAPAERLRERYRLDVRTLQEVVAIDRDKKQVGIRGGLGAALYAGRPVCGCESEGRQKNVPALYKAVLSIH